jgi:hypothetical protein
MLRVISAPHPLAAALIERLQPRLGSCVLDFGAGSGRNGEALRRGGFRVATIGDDAAMSETPLASVRGPFDAVISTHGFLHGNRAAVAARVHAVAGVLARGGLFYATFGSTRDARFGAGRRIDDSTFALLDGDERGIAHVYFDRELLRALLTPHFEIESLREQGVDEVAGSWAHRRRPLEGAVHWFAIARRR